VFPRHVSLPARPWPTGVPGGCASTRIRTCAGTIRTRRRSGAHDAAQGLGDSSPCRCGIRTERGNPRPWQVMGRHKDTSFAIRARTTSRGRNRFITCATSAARSRARALHRRPQPRRVRARRPGLRHDDARCAAGRGEVRWLRFTRRTIDFTPDGFAPRWKQVYADTRERLVTRAVDPPVDPIDARDHDPVIALGVPPLALGFYASPVARNDM